MLDKYFSAQVEDFKKVLDERARMREQLKSPDKILKYGIEPTILSLACEKETDVASFAKRQASDRAIFNTILPKLSVGGPDDPLFQIQLDNYLKTPPLVSGVPKSVERFFLEGEGYGTFMIQTSMKPGQTVRGGVPGMISLEDGASPLKDLYEKVTNCDFDERCVRDFTEFDYRPKNPKTICADLQTLSIAAFQTKETTAPKEMGAVK